MIRRTEDKLFILDTDHTTYAFRILPAGQAEHLYYGRRIHITEGGEGLAERHAFPPGTTCLYDEENKNYSPEDMRFEMSAPGKGDLRSPGIVVRHADGSGTSDFVFEEARIVRGTVELPGLPGAYADREDKGVETLVITMKDHSYDLTLRLRYTVFPECDVITRSSELVNESKQPVTVERLMSAMVDMDAGVYTMTTFHGAWIREMRRTDTVLQGGMHVSGTTSGVSSNRANPFFMIGRDGADEDRGLVYGFNLIYSGNHMEAAEVSPFGKLRILTGINPEGFSWQLLPGEGFQSPEAVMTCSGLGYNGMSRNMHHFVREHIVRGEWKKKVRPVLLNSWEAAYFKINESKLLKLARAGKEAGIELFVMDDGWFGDRSDDTRALGDWDVNEKKLPGGLKGIGDKLKALGLDFGLWVEPEMISVNSRLYELHPDWAMDIPGHMHSEGRNQRFLDLSRTEVQDHIIEQMTRVFQSADISYVKWDMNRSMTDVFSRGLPPDRQKETGHRYVLGLYRIMQTLTERFPHILFEGCASGGNRFDLGILSYFPQIWASDDSDAVARTAIQTGYSYGYPMSCVTAHVSDVPNHQTLRRTSLATRFNVAAFGVLGYECNLCDMKKAEREEIKQQIAFYKTWREVFFFGDFYRGRSLGLSGETGAPLSPIGRGEGNIAEWTVVSPDGRRAAGLLLQLLALPNVQTEIYRAKGLLAEKKYHFQNQKMKYNIKEFGGLVNAVAPVHVKPDSLLHNALAKKIKMDGETEDIRMYGDALMEAGVHVAQAFSGTGYSGEVRHMPDFASRLYTMEVE